MKSTIELVFLEPKKSEQIVRSKIILKIPNTISAKLVPKGASFAEILVGIFDIILDLKISFCHLVQSKYTFYINFHI